MRFIKPCQFSAASQSYRFCLRSGLVPPQHREKIIIITFRILKNLPVLRTQSAPAGEREPWE